MPSQLTLIVTLGGSKGFARLCSSIPFPVKLLTVDSVKLGQIWVH